MEMSTGSCLLSFWSGRRRRTIPYLSVRIFFFCGLSFFRFALWTLSLTIAFLKKKVEEKNIPTLKRNPIHHENSIHHANPPLPLQREVLYTFFKRTTKEVALFSPLFCFSFFFRFNDVYTRFLFLRVFFPFVTFAQLSVKPQSWVEIYFLRCRKKVTLFIFAVDANRAWNAFDVLLVGSPQVTSARSSFMCSTRAPSLSFYYWSILSSAERCKLHNRARGYFFNMFLFCWFFFPIKKRKDVEWVSLRVVFLLTTWSITVLL